MNFTNKLAILLLSTENEYKNNMVKECIEKYFLKNASVNFKVDLHIYFNTGSLGDYWKLHSYNNLNCINKIFIKSLNLSSKEDWYCRTHKDFEKLKDRWDLKLGGSSGPNNLFYLSFKNLFGADYRDILLIETDSFPVKENWIDKIIEYCDENKFLIAGSLYKGKQEFEPYQVWTGHLNGVAIYRNTPF